VKTKIIDCTIRDGGHLNNWNFSEDCVKATYDAAVKTGIDYFELGYRCDNPDPNSGAFSNCKDDFIFNLLDLNDDCKISLMIDTGKCSSNNFSNCSTELTPVKLIRIATYPNDLDKSFLLCESLKEKGYNISLNLMAISRFNEYNFEKLASWKNKNLLESICFADSFGSFIPNDIEYYGKKLKLLGFPNISFHAHNNLQLAVANSIRAIECGFYSIDASVYGMGRDAGILPIEILITYLNKLELKNFNQENYISIIQKYYTQIYKTTPWGYGIKPLIGGINDIHPKYIKTLFDNNSNNILADSQTIKELAPISFSLKDFENIILK